MLFDLTDVADPQRSFLNDVVVDTYRQVAYITDSGISVIAGEPIKGALSSSTTATTKSEEYSTPTLPWKTTLPYGLL